MPLLMWCNAAPFARATRVLFRRDAVFAGLVAALGATNGYSGALCLSHGPKRMRRPEEREAAAVAINAAVVVGIATGSSASYFLKELL